MNEWLQKFYDLKTIQKLTILVLISTVFMVGVAITGFYFNYKSNESIQVIYNSNLQPIRWINLFRIHLNANRSNVLAMILEEDKTQRQLYYEDINTRLEESKTLIADFQKEMEKLNNTAALEELKVLKEKTDKYRDERSKIIALALDGKNREAFRLYQANSALAKEIFASVSKLASNIEDRAEKRNEQSKKDFHLCYFCDAFYDCCSCWFIWPIKLLYCKTDSKHS